MNTINLTGNICGELELKRTQSGKSVMTFNLAVKRPYKKDTTDFIPVVVWNQNADYLSKYARKGTKIEVSGKLTTRSYEDKEGKKKTVFEVEADMVAVLDSKADAPTEQTETPNFVEVDADGDLPF